MNWRSFPAVISTRSASPWRKGSCPSPVEAPPSISRPRFSSWPRRILARAASTAIAGDRASAVRDSRAVSVPYLRPTARPLRPDSPGRPGRGDGVLGAGRRNECICRHSQRARAAQSLHGQINRHLGVRDGAGQICSPARGECGRRRCPHCPWRRPCPSGSAHHRGPGRSRPGRRGAHGRGHRPPRRVER